MPQVYWWEGLLLILGYCSYILFMRFNEKLLGKLSETGETPSLSTLRPCPCS